jgi:hypothetical protein
VRVLCVVVCGVRQVCARAFFVCWWCVEKCCQNRPATAQQCWCARIESIQFVSTHIEGYISSLPNMFDIARLQSSRQGPRAPASASGRNIVESLSKRAVGTELFHDLVDIPETVTHRIDSSHGNMASLISQLSAAIIGSNWVEVGTTVTLLINRILTDAEEPPAQVRDSPKKKAEMNMFVALGGVTELLKVMEPPHVHPDARQHPMHRIRDGNEIWNEVLVLLREICFATPLLADRVFSKSHIIFLFTMLRHSAVFENTMNLLEEILAVRVETFSLAEVRFG